MGIYNTAENGENFLPGLLTYREPRIDGYRLDWCRVWAGDCGKGAADAFCRLHGHARAVEWEMDPDIGLRSPTRVIATGQICNEGFCDGFKFIKCEAAAPPSPGTGPVQLEAEIKGRSYLDRVGPGEGLGGNGSPDYLVQARVTAPGKVLVRVVMKSVNGEFSVWDTVPGNGMWQMAVMENGRLLNRGDGSVEIPLQGGSHLLDLLIEDNGSLSRGTTDYLLELFFSDGSKVGQTIRHPGVVRDRGFE